MRKELIIGRGKEAQQSQALTDITVSKKHLLLTLSTDREEKPYHIELLNLNNVVYVNNEDIGAEGYIDVNDKVQLGENKVELDVRRAIEDLNRQIDVAELPTQKPLHSDKREDGELPHNTNIYVDDYSPTDNGININLWFKIANCLLIVLLILATSLKKYTTIHTIILLLLVGTILFDIILYTKKKK